MRANRTIAAVGAAACLFIWPAAVTAQLYGNEFGKVYGSLTVGPSGVPSFNWVINDGGPSTTFPAAPGVAAPAPDVNNQVSGWTWNAAIKIRPQDTGNLTWAAGDLPQYQLNFSLQTLLGPKTTIGNDVPGAMTDFDRNLPYSWLVFSWSGTYVGPTDDAALTSTVLFDTTNFVNQVAPTSRFSFHLDSANNQIDLLYAVPEPGTFALPGLGLLAAWRYRRRAGRCLAAGFVRNGDLTHKP